MPETGTAATKASRALTGVFKEAEERAQFDDPDMDEVVSIVSSIANHAELASSYAITEPGAVWDELTTIIEDAAAALYAIAKSQGRH